MPSAIDGVNDAARVYPRIFARFWRGLPAGRKNNAPQGTIERAKGRFGPDTKGELSQVALLAQRQRHGVSHVDGHAIGVSDQVVERAAQQRFVRLPLGKA